jgi:hypothetical protein
MKLLLPASLSFHHIKRDGSFLPEIVAAEKGCCFPADSAALRGNRNSAKKNTLPGS